ncbi:hypothetical protein NXU87_12645 [Candidatus Bacteroides intestinigallinarum]|jgi:hypothetical protein|uniref:hypothetical protein n=1 Tax=Bacteroides TaxID=816 RepID=UPI001313DCE8|nr:MULTISPECIES: hypothetical protein [Bacteroides]MCS3176948.1 hypothetical protein [Candidatus Bacteroides intestinigallinarum]DAJ40754.1 MAG TPA: hypothetical protein [Caudoviricetes sp.]
MERKRRMTPEEIDQWIDKMYPLIMAENVRIEMKVIKCTGKPKSPKFDLRTLNQNLLR